MKMVGRETWCGEKWEARRPKDDSLKREPDNGAAQITVGVGGEEKGREHVAGDAERRLRSIALAQLVAVSPHGHASLRGVVGVGESTR